jgi:hypothetical protein
MILSAVLAVLAMTVIRTGVVAYAIITRRTIIVHPRKILKPRYQRGGGIKMINGMLVNGFIVRAKEGNLSYGLFPSVEAANAWVEMMTIPVVVEPVYAPTFNRG